MTHEHELTWSTRGFDYFNQSLYNLMFVLNATHKVTGKKKNRNNEVVKPTLLAVLHGSKFYYSNGVFGIEVR